MNKFIHTDYGDVQQEIVKRAANIRLLICDVDGVLSNGLLYMGNQGEELKAFHVHDGYGIRCLKNCGIEVAIITAGSTQLVEDRAKMLKIAHVYQGQEDKRVAYNELLTILDCKPEEVVYIGDDLIDWPVMKEVGLSVAVANAHPRLLANAHYVTHLAGGYGAVRELCDLILLANEKLEGA
ncbi:3-deoxy-manno-octulosonate-8-phosphatase KdsC [Candidatus Fukatsuia symbiotica]|uniref:3-deoxy-D-manno-octulosonate 8-phosphate phosphatase KdsC n=1 Tax=Candidatus Fukatsuia symbiotica TaxID=1878942 RepID=A0A2U8I6Y9_9GAMM|nr:3-deoxy-manno-octulosonate-8-phosphatase KdsC [Candidatus Fukatsuia symbiotica]AWK14941.1 3-deoxy-D-manno-octulosonate 8-phosphate phosphatase [Candidatus Fukatsuia symbiotica]MEA9445299.1 3-deoxy-manno-octulosonate-8-phosphatase KdsC [Candidatus Fukatsuia symbiotica]